MRYFITHFDIHGFHHTCGAAGHIHGGFVGFKGNQGIVFGNGVAHFHFYGNHVHIFMAADIGHFHGCNRCGGRRGNGGRSGCGRRNRFRRNGLCGRGGRRGFWCSCFGRSGFHHHNHAAFRYFVAHFDFHFFHHAGGIGRHIHGGFVGFEGDQGVVHGDGVAGFNGHINHVHIFMAADIGHFDFYDLAHRVFL